jgi:hypothetical protein
MADTLAELILALDDDSPVDTHVRAVKQALAQKAGTGVAVRVMLPDDEGWSPFAVDSLDTGIRIREPLPVLKVLQSLQTAPFDDGTVLSLWLLRNFDLLTAFELDMQVFQSVVTHLLEKRRIMLHIAYDPIMENTREFVTRLQGMLSAAAQERLSLQKVVRGDDRIANIAVQLYDLITRPLPPPAPAPDNGIRSVWEVHEPDDPYMRVPHELKQWLSTPDGWHLVGASIRGRSHAHDGKFREDAFEIDTADGWNIIAVSDGAGSRQYSRVGSLLATQAASRAMKNYLLSKRIKSDIHLVEAHLHAALHAGVQHAYQALEKHVRDEREVEITFGDLGCTLLLAIYGEVDGRHFVAGLQIGDGLIVVARDPDQLDNIQEITQGDIADFSGGTTFLTSEKLETWQQREASIYTDAQPPWLLLVMTDGVADDMVPYDRNVPRFLLPAIQRTGILNMATGLDEAASQLAVMINYEKKGSAQVAVSYRHIGATEADEISDPPLTPPPPPEFD